MRHLILLPIAFVAWQTRAQVLTTQWLRTAGGFTQFAPYRVASDHAGHVYTVGNGDAMNYGNGFTIAQAGPAIARYTASGDILWARALTAPGEIATIMDIATNSAGDLWVAGHFLTSSLTLDGMVLSNAGTSSAFVARFDANGDVQFAKSWGGDGASSTWAQAIALNAQDRVFITGTSSAAGLDFGGGVSVVNSAGGEQAVTLAMDQDGLAQWASMSASSGGGVNGLCIAADPAGNAYMAARFDGTLLIDGTELTTGITDHVALVEHSSMGSVGWMHAVAACDPLDLTVDADGNTYLCGDFQTVADFDGTVLTPSVLDGFVSAYQADGDFRWVTAVQGEIDNELCWSVVLDQAQTGLVVAGTFVLNASFGGIPVQTGTSPTDGFVMMLDTTGTVGWVHDMTGDGPTLYAHAILDENDRIYASGTTQSQTLYLGWPVLNAEGNNAFLARFDEITLSVQDAHAVQPMPIYPNPCRGTFTIALPADVLEVTIADGAGRLLQRQRPGSGLASFTMDEPGVYMITVLFDHGRTTGRLVVE